MKSLSRVRLFATPWTAAYQAPPSMPQRLAVPRGQHAHRRGDQRGCWGPQLPRQQDLIIPIKTTILLVEVCPGPTSNKQHCYLSLDTLLYLILPFPSGINSLTVTDLCSAFFSTPVDEVSQYLLAFIWEERAEGLLFLHGLESNPGSSLHPRRAPAPLRQHVLDGELQPHRGQVAAPAGTPLTPLRLPLASRPLPGCRADPYSAPSPACEWEKEGSALAGPPPP